MLIRQSTVRADQAQTRAETDFSGNFHNRESPRTSESCQSIPNIALLRRLRAISATTTALIPGTGL